MITPKKAYEIYNDAVIAANGPYEKYWLDRFAADGVKFTPGSWSGLYNVTHNSYEIELQIHPRHREGAVLRFKPLIPDAQGYTYWREKKIMSETGYHRFMLALTHRRLP